MQLPEIVRSVDELRERVGAWRSGGDRVGLVPTMGALHEGHLSLVRLANERTERAVVSIFVNPTQFAPTEDLSAYPRDEAGDVAKLAGLADLVYAPGPEEMYPEDFSTEIAVGGVSEPLEGSFRPTHFAGVATVVAKLLLQTGPTLAIFGEKDYQQLLVIRRMVRDLDIPVEILGGPIAREPDGLALSSRNAYLSDEERVVAGMLNRILSDTAEKVAEGAPIRTTCAHGVDALKAAGFDKVDYLEVRHADTLSEFRSGKAGRPSRALVAAKIGRTRLIDNMPVPFRD